jgi:hypothetical protein
MDVIVAGGTRKATDSESANFVAMAIDLETALSTGISRLRTQQDLFADAQESRRLRVKIGELTAELAMVHAELHAALAGERAIAPPTDDQVGSMKKLVTSLDELIAGQQQTSAILKAVTDAANAWAGRQPAKA